MKKILRSFSAVVVIAAVVLVAKSANSEQTLGALAPSIVPSGSSGSSTLGTTLGLLPLATTGAIIYFVVIKKDDKAAPPGTTPPVEDAGGGYVMSEQEAEKWVELYLRDHSEQLTADIARGYGPALNDLSAILRIQPEHRALFGATLQANASELLPFANKNSLTGKRAAHFFERMGDLLRADGALKHDLAAHHG